jgi:hypothetical protein
MQPEGAALANATHATLKPKHCQELTSIQGLSFLISFITADSLDNGTRTTFVGSFFCDFFSFGLPDPVRFPP